jgi:iron complex outermembrane receptor protein
MRIRFNEALAIVCLAASAPIIAADTYHIEIAPQRLATALQEFAKQSGLQVVYFGKIADGHSANGVSGDLTAAQALHRLLAGTDLKFESLDPNTVAISTAGESPTASQANTVWSPGALADGSTAADAPYRVIRLSQADAQAEKAGSAPAGEDEVIVTGTYETDGQLARSSSLGILGSMDHMSTPYSVVSFTDDFARDAQAKDVREVLRYDASVKDSGGNGGISPFFAIRGFSLSKAELGVNGLYGMANPDGYLDVAPYERIEVIKGPSALLQGAVEGGIGGSVSMVTKRAADKPLARLSTNFETDDVFGGAIDVGRRFGANGEWGVRTNLLYRDGSFGDTRMNQTMKIGSVALDYRGERLRASFDYVGQRQSTDGTGSDGCDYWNLNANPDMSRCPNSGTWWNAFQDFDLFIVAAEYDLNDRWKIGMKHGRNKTDDQWPATYPNWSTVDEDAGTVELANQMWAYILDPESTEVNLSGKFETGSIGHEVVVGASLYERENHNTWYELPTGVRVPLGSTPPPINLSRMDRDDVPYYGKSEYTSYALVDRLSFKGGRYQMLLGLRHQIVKDTPAEGDTYDESAVTPSVGLMYKPSAQWLFYGSYIEDLEPGPRAPENQPTATPPRFYSNAGKVFAPTQNTQYEIGGKWDSGKLGATLALFEIAEMNGIAVPTGTEDTYEFKVDGERRHRGLEMSLFGEPYEGTRIMGGYTYLDATLAKTEGGLGEGDRVMGVPEHRLVLNAEHDFRALPGLTFIGGVTSVSDTDRCGYWLDPADCGQIPGYSIFDLGVRYQFEIADKAARLRLVLHNVADKKYLLGAHNDGYLIFGEGRMVAFGAEVDL